MRAHPTCSHEVLPRFTASDGSYTQLIGYRLQYIIITYLIREPLPFHVAYRTFVNLYIIAQFGIFLHKE